MASLKAQSDPGLVMEMGLGKGALGQLGTQLFSASLEVKQLYLCKLYP